VTCARGVQDAPVVKRPVARQAGCGPRDGECSDVVAEKMGPSCRRGGPSPRSGRCATCDVSEVTCALSSDSARLLLMKTSQRLRLRGHKRVDDAAEVDVVEAAEHEEMVQTRRLLAKPH